MARLAMLYNQKVFPIKTIPMFGLSSKKLFLSVTFRKSNYFKFKVNIVYESSSKEEINGNSVLM